MQYINNGHMLTFNK